MREIDFKYLREMMVKEQLQRRDIREEKVLEAFRHVPREKFVPLQEKKFAYQDHPLSIGLGQTISQPYMVALMTQALSLKGKEKVLEIGTGSGYQAAILAHMGAEVYSVERLLPLSQKAKETLERLGYQVHLKVGDGSLGWQEYAPYERIIVTAGAFKIPPPLLEQLEIGGILVIPVGGSFSQDLTVIHKISSQEFREEKICGCIFVPLIGKYGYKK